jgi:hypothetical protein
MPPSQAAGSGSLCGRVRSACRPTPDSADVSDFATGALLCAGQHDHSLSVIPSGTSNQALEPSRRWPNRRLAWADSCVPARPGPPIQQSQHPSWMTAAWHGPGLWRRRAAVSGGIAGGLISLRSLVDTVGGLRGRKLIGSRVGGWPGHAADFPVLRPGQVVARGSGGGGVCLARRPGAVQ